MRLLLEAMLRDHGYDVLLAAGPDEAVALAAEHAGAIDVVVSDIDLPRMSGPELVESLHAIQPAFEVLFLSGYSAETIPGRQPPAGAEFLQKPFDEISLVQTIGLLLARRASPLA